ncbi:MAG: tetratricopeptide repeat protein [Coleofasciculus sp. S288]|nr:tetratricopeptide repeat protein [Coleofasciculus sp. S288]
MRSRFKHFYFIAATLLLSLTSPLLACATDFEPQIVQVQTAQDRKAEAERLIQEANSQFSQAQSDEITQEANSQLIERQYQKSLDSFQQALSIYQELAVSEASPIAKRHEVQEVCRRQRDILFMIGVIYGKLGQYEQVLKYSQQALALEQELGHRCQEQETLFRISSVYGVLGQYDQVLEGLGKILAINREHDEPCQNSHLLFAVHNVYQMLGQPDLALKVLEQLLAFDTKVGDRIGERSILLLISEMYEQQKQYEQAIQSYQQALAIDRELGVSEATPQEAHSQVMEAYIINEVREPYILTRIGGIYEQQGNYDKALQFYQQALTINREINPTGVATLMTLSRVYQRLGQYEQMLESYQQALAADRSASPMYDQGQQYVMSLSRQYIYMSLSQVYQELDQDEQVQKSYQQALAIGKKLGNFEPSMRALNDWGSVQVRNGKFQEALETFEKALAISREVAQESRTTCGAAFLDPHNPGVTRLYPPNLAGSKCGTLTAQSGLEGAETIIFKNLGFVYRKLGQPEKSRESYEQALKRYQQKFARLRESNESCWLADELRIFREIAQLYKILGEDNLAREFYRQADKLEFVQYVRGVSCDELGEVGSGIVLTDDDESSTPRQSR